MPDAKHSKTPRGLAQDLLLALRNRDYARMEQLVREGASPGVPYADSPRDDKGLLQTVAARACCSDAAKIFPVLFGTGLTSVPKAIEGEHSESILHYMAANSSGFSDFYDPVDALLACVDPCAPAVQIEMREALKILESRYSQDGALRKSASDWACAHQAAYLAVRGATPETPEEIIRLLGTAVQTQSGDTTPFVYFMVGSTRSAATFARFLDSGLSADHRVQDMTLLHYAAGANDVPLTCTLLERGATPGATCVLDRTMRERLIAEYKAPPALLDGALTPAELARAVGHTDTASAIDAHRARCAMAGVTSPGPVSKEL